MGWRFESSCLRKVTKKLDRATKLRELFWGMKRKSEPKVRELNRKIKELEHEKSSLLVEMVELKERLQMACPHHGAIFDRHNYGSFECGFCGREFDKPYEKD